jgi:hypothetical protein
MYCLAACQKLDWKAHKTACKQLKVRKQLYRAGELVRDAFLAYREQAFDLNVVKVEKKASDLYIHEGEVNGGLVPFPSKLVPDAEDKKMLLTWNSCSDALAYMHKIINDLIGGTSILCQNIKLELKISS